MYELRVREEFSAAHHLEGYPGDCARPHGHNWGVEVSARSETLDSIGLAVDFRQLKHALRELIATWDHRDLNAHADFAALPPSAEQIARISFERLAKALDSPRTRVSKVTIWENSRSSASYFEEDSHGS